ncbi:hypothetical protein [Thiorhodococcus drewsii]|uniref:hypothetical protein n=1 Tax=Thiorhodococcus drewsii TaxID=210408 RepID=UPI0005941502|nr:hypothetical protein [Thiorhodococcus drewsii]
MEVSRWIDDEPDDAGTNDKVAESLIGHALCGVAAEKHIERWRLPDRRERSSIGFNCEKV